MFWGFFGVGDGWVECGGRDIGYGVLERGFIGGVLFVGKILWFFYDK